MNHSQFTITQLIEVLLRNKFKFAFVFLITLALVVAYWLFAPRLYGSEGQLFVQLGRANSAVEYTSGSSAMPISIQNSRETEVRSVMSLIHSHEVLAKVCLDPEVTVDAVLESPFDWITEMLPTRGGGGGGSGDLSTEEYRDSKRLQQAVKILSSNIKVSLEKKTTVISVYIKAQSPSLAKRIIDRILHYASQAHVNVHRRSGTVDFFETEFENQKKIVHDAELKLQNFRNGTRDGESSKPFLSIEGARETLQGVINKLELQMVDIDLDQNQAEEEVRRFSEQLAAIGKFVSVPTKGVERTSTEAAQEEVFRLRSEQAELQATYRSHPRLDIIGRRLRSLESDINVLPVDRTEVEAVSNPAYEDVSVERAKAVARSRSLPVKLSLAKQKYNAALEELKRLNETEVGVNAMKRDVETEKKYLRSFVDRRGDVNLMNRLDESNVSDVKIHQPGVLLVKHISPRGSVVLPLGFMFATGLAVLTCLIFDGGSKVLSRDENIEEALDLPVLVTIPRVSNRRALVR